jgi:hypothetical protein
MNFLRPLIILLWFWIKSKTWLCDLLSLAISTESLTDYEALWSMLKAGFFTFMSLNFAITLFCVLMWTFWSNYLKGTNRPFPLAFGNLRVSSLAIWGRLFWFWIGLMGLWNLLADNSDPLAFNSGPVEKFLLSLRESRLRPDYPLPDKLCNFTPPNLTFSKVRMVFMLSWFCEFLISLNGRRGGLSIFNVRDLY